MKNKNLYADGLVFGIDYDIDFYQVDSDPGDDNVTIRLERVPLTPERADFWQTYLPLVEREILRLQDSARP